MYCGCAFDQSKRVSPNCGVKSDTYANRIGRIEWEHVVPVSDFGRQLFRSCYNDSPSGTSGRQHCRDTDPEFARAEGDPWNLIPAIGTLNAVRSNYRFGEVPGEPRAFGVCDFEISEDGAGRFVEVPESVKGDVARAYNYMSWRYGYRIGRSQKSLLEAWAALDPVDEWERIRAQRIFEVTGMPNPIYGLSGS